MKGIDRIIDSWSCSCGETSDLLFDVRSAPDRLVGICGRCENETVIPHNVDELQEFARHFDRERVIDDLLADALAGVGE